MKNIEFFIQEDALDSTPHPRPAAKFIPKWYQQLENYNTDDPTDVGTLKNCLPFRDALTSGYIIPLWEDMRLTSTDYDNKWDNVVSYQWSRNLCQFNKGAISAHKFSQIEGCPITEKDLGHIPLKFNCPWLIRTPPGYSCLFTMPFNKYDQKFELITGIVDTDTYFDKIAFPFIYLEKGVDEVIHQGTPLVQVTPFKRDQWSSKIKKIGRKEQLRLDTVSNSINSVFRKGYFSKFWTKKKYT